MCNCIGMCRTFDESPSGFAPSLHHPKCEDYKLIKCAQIHVNGSGSVIVEMHEAQEFIDIEIENGGDKEDYSISPIFITRDQLENLSEFDGF